MTGVNIAEPFHPGGIAGKLSSAFPDLMPQPASGPLGKNQKIIGINHKDDPVFNNGPDHLRNNQNISRHYLPAYQQDIEKMRRSQPKLFWE